MTVGINSYINLSVFNNKAVGTRHAPVFEPACIRFITDDSYGNGIDHGKAVSLPGLCSILLNKEKDDRYRDH